MLNLNKKIDRKKSSNKKGIFFRITVALLLISVAIFTPLKIAFEGFKEVQNHSKAIASAYQQQNFGQVVDETKAARDSLQKVNRSLGFLFWVGFIPVLGGYYNDIHGLTSAGVDELNAVSRLLEKLKPSEKELGFLGTPLAGQDRVSQAIKVLDKSLPILPDLRDEFKKAADKVKNIETGKYPENFRGLELRKSLTTARDFITGIYYASSEYSDGLKITPAVLGQPTPKTYLMLFQNDKEIRPTGGFLTAYAFLKIDHGQISTSISDDIYRLDERLQGTCLSKICPLSPPAPIAKYLPEVDGKPRKSWSLRDSNISPDVPTSAKEFERMYQLLGQGFPFDGIIYIDSQVVEELIEVTGEITIFDTPYSSKIDHRCNCPNVIYELESYAEIAAKGQQDRKAILGVLMQQVLGKLLGTSSEKIPQAIEAVVRLANHKHIMFYMHDQSTQAALSKLNWIGQIKDYEGDYLHVNDANFAGGKSNLYLDEKVTQDIKVSGGKVIKKVIVEYKNPQAFNTWINGVSRSYVRLYVPKGSKLTSSKGSDDPVNTKEELGKTVFEAFIVTRPQNSRKLEIEYEIPYSPKDDYKLMIQKQPGAKDFDYTIKINGSTKENFKLDQDKQFKFDI